jgi:phosphoglycolate phosphatase
MQALRAVHRAGGRVLVVTAKQERLARMHIEHLQMRVELVVGDQFAEGKAAALSRHRAVGYVGDHRADMLAARAAGVPGIGVTTGPCTREELLEAGAQTVLGTLADFPAWISVSALSRGD